MFTYYRCMQATMKVKTFIFNTRDITVFNKVKDGYDVNSSSIDKKINDFCKDKDVVSVQQTSFTRGNNPPTDFLVCTVAYL